MNYNAHYHLSASNNQKFEFESVGNKGRYILVVSYESIEADKFYNLGFGIKGSDGNIDYKSVLDNGDSAEILATVALSALIFTEGFPGRTLFFEGSTPARTRLYQIGICKNLNEISEHFIIFGLLSDGWSYFVKGKNYMGFMAIRN